jgi:hypothetical protein
MSLLSSDEENESDDEEQRQQRSSLHLSKVSSSPPSQGRSLSSSMNTSGKPLSSGIGDALGTILAASKSPLLQSLSERMRATSSSNNDPLPPVKLDSPAASPSIASAAMLAAVSSLKPALSSSPAGRALNSSTSSAASSAAGVRGTATALPSPSPSPTSNSILGIFAAVAPFQPSPNKSAVRAGSHESTSMEVDHSTSAQPSSVSRSLLGGGAANATRASPTTTVELLVAHHNDDDSAGAGVDDDGRDGADSEQDDHSDQPMAHAQVLV